MPSQCTLVHATPERTLPTLGGQEGRLQARHVAVLSRQSALCVRPLQGVNAYDNDLDVMRAPHPAHDPRVLFCGEHLSKAYFQCVDGAFDTGT